MPSRPDRVRVWNGELKRTRGGLMRIDLVKNKAGKIVSKRRSATARSASNLGKWLRVKGSKFRDVPEGAVKRKATPKPKPAAPKPKKAETKPTPKPKPAAPKLPKKAEQKPKRPAAAPKKAKPKPKASLPSSKYGMSGKVAQPAVPKKRDRSKVTVQNVRSGKRRRPHKKVPPKAFVIEDYDYV